MTLWDEENRDQKIRNKIENAHCDWPQKGRDRLLELFANKRSRGLVLTDHFAVILTDEPSGRADDDYFENYAELIADFYRTRLGRSYRDNQRILLKPNPALVEAGHECFIKTNSPFLGGAFLDNDLLLHDRKSNRGADVRLRFAESLRFQIDRAVSDLGCQPVVAFNCIELGSNFFGFLAASEGDAALLKLRLSASAIMSGEQA